MPLGCAVMAEVLGARERFHPGQGKTTLRSEGPHVGAMHSACAAMVRVGAGTCPDSGRGSERQVYSLSPPSTPRVVRRTSECGTRGVADPT